MRHILQQASKAPNPWGKTFLQVMAKKDAWSSREERIIWWLLNARTEYLENLNIDVSQLPEPPELGYLKSDYAIDTHQLGLSVSFRYSQERVADLKKMFKGCRWDSAEAVWWLPITTYNADTVLLKARDEVKLSEEALGNIAYRESLRKLWVEGSKALDADINLRPGFGLELLPFQRAGVRYMVSARNCIMADQMGTGKTIQSLAAVHQLLGFPLIVVCPASLKINWAREAERALPDRTISVWSTTKPCPETEIVIINYDILGKKLQDLINLNARAIIFDESHYLKNHKAKRTQDARTLARKIKYRFALSGTPVLSRPIELVSQLMIVDRLEHLGGFDEFVNTHCKIKLGKDKFIYTGARHLEKLNEDLRSCCYVRRTKEEVLKDLPPKRMSVVPIEVKEDKYQQLEENFLFQLDDIESRDITSREKFSLSLTEISALKQETLKLKLPLVYEWIDSVLDTGEKLLVFIWHKLGAEALGVKYRAPVINGDTPMDARQEYVDRFQNDPECNLLVLSIKAAGVGLNLTAASNVAFLELGWTPADHEQAEDRAHRIGQVNPVNIWYLLGVNTVDEEIWGVLQKKKKIVDKTTDGGLKATVNKVIEALRYKKVAQQPIGGKK